jgi:hypothetical protein
MKPIIQAIALTVFATLILPTFLCILIPTSEAAPYGTFTTTNNSFRFNNETARGLYNDNRIYGFKGDESFKLEIKSTSSKTFNGWTIYNIETMDKKGKYWDIYAVLLQDGGGVFSLTESKQQTVVDQVLADNACFSPILESSTCNNQSSNKVSPTPLPQSLWLLLSGLMFLYGAKSRL